MAFAVQRDLVGLVAFSRDGTKLGKIKAVIDGPDASAYAVIGRFLARDLVVPAEVLDTSGDRLVVPFSSSFIDMAPAVKAKDVVSPEEHDRLEQFFKVRSS